MTTTREQLLEAALQLFAEKGFWGVSLSQVAECCSITKQSLLHHFGSKEKLYREVLGRIAGQLQGVVQQATAAVDQPEAQLVAVLEGLDSGEPEMEQGLRVIMRELLDIGDRAATARSWPMMGFLDGLDSILAGSLAWRERNKAERLAAVYQCLGAVNYKVMSRTTLQGMYGKTAYGAFEAAHRIQLRNTVRWLLDPDGINARGR